MSQAEDTARLIYEAMHKGWNVTPWESLGNGQDIYLDAARAVLESIANQRDMLLEAAKLLVKVGPFVADGWRNLKAAIAECEPEAGT